MYVCKYLSLFSQMHICKCVVMIIIIGICLDEVINE